MTRDFRSSEIYREVEAFYSQLVAPGSGHVYGCSDLAVDPSGAHAVICGLKFDGALEDGPSTALYHVALTPGADLRPLDGGDGGRLARFAPNGLGLAWVASGEDGRDRVVVAASLDGERTFVPAPGLVEDIAWSPDGRRLLAVVAGLSADLAGYQGGYALTRAAANGPAWLPTVTSGDDADLWRAAWVWERGDDAFRKVSPEGVNVWEACWCGGAIAIVASDDHSEGSWYRSTLRTVALDSGIARVVYAPADCIALPRGSKDGGRIAFVEAVASDRGIICGVLKLLDLESGAVVAQDTGGVEVTALAWPAGGPLHYSGQAGDRTVVGAIDARSGANAVIWESRSLTCGQWYPSSQPVGADAALIVTESFNQPPALRLARDGALTTIHDFATPGAADLAAGVGVAETVSWRAPDGRTIHGVLVRPHDLAGPAPFVLDIHGGPVWANRNRWLIHSRATPLLLRRGYCVLYPNPRGSSTYGQEFARLVAGDMGGDDALDCMAAIDHFIAAGVADPERLACTGTSYGGFMSSWLVTQDSRIAAAAPISPVTNWVSQHLTSQIPFFDQVFLNEATYRAGGKYLTRSPIMFADRARASTLIMAGALDKNTPPTQALEFYSALREHGAEAALVIYPKDGHSLRGYPAYIDSAARIVAWFEAHL